MAISKDAKFLLESRYCRSGETPNQLFNRVAESLSLGDSKFAKTLNSAMRNRYFLPASPTLRNAGIKKTQLHPCCVLPIEDSIEGIMDTLAKTAEIFHYGGGVGFNASKLRPKGSKLSSGGESSGVVSFLSLFNYITDVVKQGGFRRGGVMCILDYNHPEIINFITSKLTGKFTNMNISVMVTDEFMEKVNTDEKIDLIFNGELYQTIKAKDLFDQIVFSAYCCGDPGILFYDRINKDNPLWPRVKLNAVNLCSEVALPEFGCCNLGAINLSKLVTKSGNFNKKKYCDMVAIGIRTLKNINAIGWFPFAKMTSQMKKHDFCGLGFMGFADALIKLGIYYDSKDVYEFFKEIADPYVEITNKIAKGSFYKRSQQPTGSLSIIANCSPGIEPVFARRFERHLTVGVVEEVSELYKSKYCRTAHEIDPYWHLNVQAQMQMLVDAGVSKTINLPQSASIEDVRNIYIWAWLQKTKGVTIFRDGCKEGVMRVKCEGDSCIL